MMSNRTAIQVAIVDDHPVVRDGLRTLPELDGRLVLVASVATAAEALDALRSLSPDVFLLDIRLPDANGIDLCRTIKAEAPRVKVLLLTSFAENDLILAAMEAGADGYLLKVNSAAKIIAAIDSVLAGGAVFDPITPVNWETNPSNPSNPISVLTRQERRVLAEVSAGKTDKEVALALGLSAKTVRNYLDRIFAKMNVSTRTQAAMTFARHARDRLL